MRMRSRSPRVLILNKGLHTIKAHTPAVIKGKAYRINESGVFVIPYITGKVKIVERVISFKHVMKGGKQWPRVG